MAISLSEGWSFYTLVSGVTNVQDHTQGGIYNLLPRQHHCGREMSNILRCCLGNRIYLLLEKQMIFIASK